MAATTSLFRRRAESDRDEGAEAPSPAPGVKEIALRVKNNLTRDAVSLLAAGVAFYALLALVPTLVALVSVYGLVANPSDIENNVQDLLDAAPAEVQNLVRSQLSAIVAESPSGLRLGALFGLVAALWLASSGVKNLMTAVNRAYHEEESRGYVKLRAVSLALTLGFVVLGAGSLLALVIAPRALSDMGAAGVTGTVLTIVRWPLAAGVIVLALALVYRYAPDRRETRWTWASPGALLATVVWLLASVGFSVYTANFGSYNETYGALGAVVVVMLWLYIGAYVVIAGAELNAELEAPRERPDQPPSS
jgi:membrane protein